MNKFLLALSLLSSFASAQILTCQEVCQYWNDFDNVCYYGTKCEVGPKFARYTTCVKFDQFDHKCIQENTQMISYHLNPHAKPLSCTESCQYFDPFEQKCQYQTKCEYQSDVLKFTSCGRWNPSEQKCYYQAGFYSWNAY